MRQFLVTVVILLCLISTSKPAHACSGMPYYVSLTQLNRYDLIVDATVVEVDASGWNAILEIHRYFKGEDQHFLPVANEFWGRYNARNSRGYDIACVFTMEPWPLGQRAYIGLNPNNNGTYTNGPTYFGARYPIDNDSVTYYDSSSHELRNMSQDEFETILLNMSEYDEPLVSTFDTKYPFMRELRVTAESGMQAVIRVNHNIQRLDPVLDAFKISFDGAHTVFEINEDELYFDSFTRQTLPPDVSYDWGERIRGQNVRFSPNSSLVAIWDRNELKIYRFINYPNPRISPPMKMLFVGQINFTDEQIAQNRVLTWSDNSSTLAYLDSAGLWKWNLYRDTTPQLVVSYEDDETVSKDVEMLLIELSFTGRYIRYGSATSWEFLDTNNGNRMSNTLVTPDESRFIHFNSSIAEDTAENCETPIDLSCPIMVQQSGELRLYYWRKSDLVVVMCDATCVFRRYPTDVSQSDADDVKHAWNAPSLISATYDDEFRTVAWQLDDYRLQVDYESSISTLETWRPLYFDFSEILDSPIQSIQWDQPFFFNRE